MPRCVCSFRLLLCMLASRFTVLGIGQRLRGCRRQDVLFRRQGYPFPFDHRTHCTKVKETLPIGIEDSGVKHLKLTMLRFGGSFPFTCMYTPIFASGMDWNSRMNTLLVQPSKVGQSILINFVDFAHPTVYFTLICWIHVLLLLSFSQNELFCSSDSWFGKKNFLERIKGKRVLVDEVVDRNFALNSWPISFPKGGWQPIDVANLRNWLQTFSSPSPSSSFMVVMLFLQPNQQRVHGSFRLRKNFSSSFLVLVARWWILKGATLMCVRW